jgi:hypothetical protein
MHQKISNWLSLNLKQRNADGFLLDTLFEYDLLEQLCKNNKIIKFITQEENYNIRTAKLVNLAYNNNLLIVSGITKIDLEIIKPWSRIGLVADLLPFGNLLKSEILNRELTDEETDIEWAYKINQQINYKDILYCQDPAKHPSWFSLTIHQKEIIAKLNSIIKNNINKISQIYKTCI